jgi:hypothetical protein
VLTERKVPVPALRYVVREPHWFLGGQSLGAFAGLVAVGLLSAFTTLLDLLAVVA